MATAARQVGQGTKPWRADLFERALGVGAALMLAVVLAAVVRGWGEWGRVPGVVWAHLVTVVVALALTPALLFGRRGDRRHRRLGRVWVAAMGATAFASLFVRESSGGWSLIHILSVGTLMGVPYLWWTARTHRVAQHRFAVRGTVAGALLVAGFFTFPFGRMLGRWLLG